MQVCLGERLLTDWAYLDSAELLFYLLRRTRQPKRAPGADSLRTEDLRGKTKEQIGLELWPDVSAEQLRSKLKSRLFDLRRVLGGGDWIIFENGQYKFNSTRPYWLDAEDFERYAGEAERLQSTSPAQAIVLFQQAVQLYRGEYLEGLRQRRARKERRLDADLGSAGREWYITVQEEMQSAYLAVLHKLSRLLFRAGSFHQAAEVYRLAAVKDDFDDEAHHGFMHCLALQGKRSQALEHYRRLVKRRDDLPPATDIVQLAERLKRGEEFAVGAVQPAAAPSSRPETDQGSRAPFQVPADMLRFVGREAELNDCRAALTSSQVPRLYCLAGMGGIGKTSLAIHLGHGLRDQFPDGVLWARISTSEPLAILDSWARAYQCDFSGLPDLDSRAAALRAVLADKRILMILDDVWSAARVRSLLVGSPQSTVLITGRDLDVAQALDAQIIALPVFAAVESHELLSRRAGQERVTAEPAAAGEICDLLGHLPLALDIAARRLASRPRWSLQDMVERLRVQTRRLAELKIADQEVRASFQVSWDALDETLQRLFALLGVFAGRALLPAALGAVAELDERVARDHLEALVALSLLSAEANFHYRQHPLLADFAREHLEQPRAADARMAHYYLRFATEQRQNYLALDQEWDNLSAGLEVAHEQKLWQVTIDFADVLTNAWFVRGRFTQARQAFPRVCAAARALEEQDAYIAATINWGRACIEQSDYAEADERLQHALLMSREVNDQHGIASAQFHLGRVALELSNHEAGQRLFADSQRLFEKLGDRAGVGETLWQQARLEYRYYNYAAHDQLATQALAILRTTDKYEQTIAVLCALADTAGYQGQHSLADQYCQEALNLCKDIRYQGALPSVLYTWMGLCWGRGDHDLALAYGERSIALFKAIGDRKSQALALENLMRVYLALENYALAEDRGNQCLSLLQDLRDDWVIVYALLGLGKLFTRTDRRDEARQAWTEALRKAQVLHHPLRQEIEQLLSEL